eukprot:scaffold63665_cov19-Prasinocladus_malaysianus.AAC.1
MHHGWLASGCVLHLQSAVGEAVNHLTEVLTGLLAMLDIHGSQDFWGDHVGPPAGWMGCQVACQDGVMGERRAKHPVK